MSDLAFYDRIKKEAKFETWGGRTRSPSRRFHHLSSPPKGALGRWNISKATHIPDPEPALDWQYWNISQGKGENDLFILYVWEYPNIHETHEALLGGLISITRMNVDYTPKANTPGDIVILDEMVLTMFWSMFTLGNLSEPAPRWICFGKKTIGFWVIAPNGIEGKIGRNTLKTLPHRFLANPGRISWKNNSYIFTSDRRGTSEITLDVMGPEGDYGQGSLKLKVMGK